MSKRSDRELLRRIGPPEQWVLSPAEIERVMETAVCLHGIVPVDFCVDCFTDALLRRQLTVMAERLGCSPEDAQAVSDNLCRDYPGKPKP